MGRKKITEEVQEIEEEVIKKPKKPKKIKIPKIVELVEPEIVREMPEVLMSEIPEPITESPIKMVEIDKKSRSLVMVSFDRTANPKSLVGCRLLWNKVTNDAFLPDAVSDTLVAEGKIPFEKPVVKTLFNSDKLKLWVKDNDIIYHRFQMSREEIEANLGE